MTDITQKPGLTECFLAFHSSLKRCLPTAGLANPAIWLRFDGRMLRLGAEIEACSYVIDQAVALVQSRDPREVGDIAGQEIAARYRAEKMQEGGAA